MSQYQVIAQGADLYAHQGDITLPGLDFSQVPRARAQVIDPEGNVGLYLPPGTPVTLTRNGVPIFPGIVETRRRQRGASAETVDLPIVHAGYHRLKRRLCAPYVYDEDDLPITTRDAVFVNPWKVSVFRAPSGVLDADGNRQALHGWRPDEVALALVGKVLLVQHDFSDNRWLRPSGVASPTATIGVIEDGPTGDVRPCLQRFRTGASTFGAGGSQDSIALVNNDPNLEAMEDIQSVDVVIIGQRFGTDSPTLMVTRQARDLAPAYVSVPLTHVANYLGSGLDAWTGSLAALGAAGAVTDALGYRITVPGTAGSAGTTKVYYAALKATLTQALDGIPLDVEAYWDPITGATSGQEVWVEDDFVGMDRTTAIERVRKTTLTDDAANPSPHWDAWLDTDGTFHFKQRRGSLTPNPFSASDGSLENLQWEEVGEAVAYQTVAVGGGQGSAELVIIDRTEYVDGGLYDGDRDPAGAQRIYGDLPKQRFFKDQSVSSPVELRRRARAAHRLWRDPVDYLSATFIPFTLGNSGLPFDVGDQAQFNEPAWGLVGAVSRIAAMNLGWTESGESMKVGLGEPEVAVVQALRGQRIQNERTASKPKPTLGTSGLSGAGVYFDKTHFGRVPIVIPEGAELERVFVSCQTLPWQTTARGSSLSQVVGTTSTKAATSESSGAGAGATIRLYNGLVQHTTPVLAVGGSDLNAWLLTVPDGYVGGYLWAVRVDDVAGAQVPIDIAINFVGSQLGLAWASRAETVFGGGASGHTVSGFQPPSASGADMEISIINRDPSAVRQFNVKVWLWGIDSHTHSFTIPAHSHTLNIPAQTIPLDFGIYQFDGDGNPGTGSPVYGEGIRFAIDPVVDASGVPTTANFNAARHPAVLGNRQTPTRTLIDITPYLRTDAQGRIVPGEHLMYLLGAAYSGSAEGLSVVAVSPILRLKESNG